jgi:hypothetical protein
MVPSFHQVCFLTPLTPAWFFSVTVPFAVPFSVPFIVLRSRLAKSASNVEIVKRTGCEAQNQLAAVATEILR